MTPSALPGPCVYAKNKPILKHPANWTNPHRIALKKKHQPRTTRTPQNKNRPTKIKPAQSEYNPSSPKPYKKPTQAIDLLLPGSTLHLWDLIWVRARAEDLCLGLRYCGITVQAILVGSGLDTSFPPGDFES